MSQQTRPARLLPTVFDSTVELESKLSRLGTIFLDYDGTLSPIVAHPEDAHISDSTRGLIRDLAGDFTVAVVSGRSVEDVRDRVGVESLIYSGSHGQEIEFPGGERYEHPESQRAAPVVVVAHEKLTRLLEGLDGIKLEPKPFSLAVHTRNAPADEARAQAAAAVNSVAFETGLTVHHGKEILELRPDVEWDKGKAIEHISKGLNTDKIALFIGDDETDEDGFTALNQASGIGILVGPSDDRMTNASYRLDDPAAVIRFLRSLRP